MMRACEASDVKIARLNVLAKMWMSPWLVVRQKKTRKLAVLLVVPAEPKRKRLKRRLRTPVSPRKKNVGNVVVDKKRRLKLVVVKKKKLVEQHAAKRKLGRKLSARRLKLKKPSVLNVVVLAEPSERCRQMANQWLKIPLVVALYVAAHTWMQKKLPKNAVVAAKNAVLLVLLKPRKPVVADLHLG
jgi:hypothetical protein